MVTTLKDDLIAVKALIDTPEKLDEVGSVREACSRVCGTKTRDENLRAGEVFMAFLEQPGDPNPIARRPGAVLISYQSILDRIDRAINAAGVS